MITRSKGRPQSKVIATAGKSQLAQALGITKGRFAAIPVVCLNAEGLKQARKVLPGEALEKAITRVNPNTLSRAKKRQKVR